MQIKVFCIPLPFGEAQNEELNVFLRSKKVIQVESQVVNNGQGAFWCFNVKYVEDGASVSRDKGKVDYRQALDEATFKRFSVLREIRKKIAKEEEIPAYAVFTDEELANLAKMGEVTIAGMKNIKGIGENKIKKYGHFFITPLTNEKS